MYKKLAFLGFAFLWTIALVLRGVVVSSAPDQYQHLSAVESEIVSRINGTSIYNYDLQMEDIALNHGTSFYSFRSSGSAGANETAMWIRRQFESFGLDTHNESFELTTWNLLAQPVLTIDADGNLSTTDDQVAIRSFQCEHYSWPTPEGGVFANLVTLPLPQANSRQEVGFQQYDAGAWLAVDTTGKVLLIGGEVQWSSTWYLAFRNKLVTQTPAAVIFAWSYSWMAGMPAVFSPGGGHDFWDLKIPVGWVNYDDGQLIRSKMGAGNVFAFVSIGAVIRQGPQYNIVAKLRGSVNPGKMIIISGHYDSVVDAAFCDDGAGTAAVLELARVFSEAAHEDLYKPQCTLVFIAFAGGELRLAGSVNYAKQHASELGDIVAVINLDSLGSKTMEISKTFPDDSGLDLQSVVMNAGNDLGVSISLTDPLTRSSDQEAFRDPTDTDDRYLTFWGTRPGIRNDTRVKSSIMIDSYPLTWVHTENDNSNSTSSLGWVTSDSLESQTRVAGLSVMRVLSTIFSPFLLELYGSLAVAGAVVVVVAYFERSRLMVVYKRFSNEVRSKIGLREDLYIVILTVFFLFASFAFHLRVGETEVIRQGYPRTVPIEYFGTPFEMFGIITPELGTSEGGSQFVQVRTGGIIMFWGGIVANFLLSLLSAFVIIFAVTKVRYVRGL